jgi:hypothetical protein
MCLCHERGVEDHDLRYCNTSVPIVVNTCKIHYKILLCAFLSVATISGGSVRWPWNFLFAQAACELDKPSLYAMINRADRFAYLCEIYKVSVKQK